jgi:hypothetical protein
MTAEMNDPVGNDRLETDLIALFATQPGTAVLARLDGRVHGRLQSWEPSSVRRSRLRPGRRAGLIGLLAATLAIGGATGSLQALYQVIAGPFDVPWHRGVAVEQSQVVDGYRVTIDRAYADASRLALAISVVDELERPGTTQLHAMAAVVTDESGEYGGMGASSSPDGPFAAVNIAWKVPADLPLPAGPRTFHVVVPFIMVRDNSTPPPNADEIHWTPWREHAGPWTFDFELDVDGGTTMQPDIATEVDGVTVRVSRVIASSDIIRVEAHIDGVDGSWAPVGSISRGSRTVRFVVSSLEADGSIALLTDGGVPDASGDWTVTFEELVGDSERLPGPWVLRFAEP